MIESLLIGFFGGAILFSILSVEEESVYYSMMSFFFWIMTSVGVLYIQRTGESTAISEWGLSIPFLMISVIQIAWTIKLWLDWKRAGRMKV